MNNKKFLFILLLFGLISTFFGGTLAYWEWTTSTAQQTKVVFTVGNEFSCAADGVETKITPPVWVN